MNNNLPNDLRLVYERLQKGAVEEAMAILEDKNLIFIEWQKDDIIMRADDVNIFITEKDAQDILSRMVNSHDCNFGITWDTIDSCLQDYQKEE